MSGHADTIRDAFALTGDIDRADEALDALLAENQRLREALHAIWIAPDDAYTKAGLRLLAREALAGDTE